MNQGAKRPGVPPGDDATITNGVTNKGIREQLDRILRSPLFATAEKRRLLLCFLVERSLEGRGEGLKEYEVGREVFGRPASYDPRLDPIVRVQVSNLRSKLREYYAGDGKNDPVLIEFPRGYVPRIERRPVLHVLKSNKPSIQAIRSTRASRAEEKRAAKTVAVLPFLDLSPGGDQEYFCDGVTEEIINALSQIRQVSVVARTSAFQFKGTSVDVRQIGAQLNAQAVLEGSIRKEGDLLRVLARLTSVESGYVLWSASFDRKIQDVSAVQEEVAKAIIKTLNIRFGRSQQQRLSRRTYKANVELYDLYLRGRFYWNRRTEEALRMGASIFQQIIAQDDSYAPAFSGLADCYLSLGLSDTDAPKDVMPKARAAAKRALELDDTLAEAYTSLGSVEASYNWEWAGAQKMFQHAIHLNPGYATAHHYYAIFSLSPTGSLQEAIDELHQAITLDPLSLTVNTDTALLAYFAGRPDDAIAQCRKTIDLDPSFFRPYWLLGLACAQSGIYPEAIRSFERVRELAGGKTFMAPALAGLAYVYALAGKHDEARKCIQELESRASQEYVSPFWVAMAHVGLNQRKQVFAWLERACDMHDPWFFVLPNLPIAAPLESDHRYRSFLHKINIARNFMAAPV
jgi:serine/threonine-protein kinase